MGILSKIFGSSSIIEKGMEIIDKQFPSDVELIEVKAKAKVDLLESYSAFKIAQRYIAFSFTAVFLFIMSVGIFATLYNIVDVTAVEQARAFANEMWLGEIMLTIVAFYFGGGFLESKKRSER